MEEVMEGILAMLCGIQLKEAGQWTRTTNHKTKFFGLLISFGGHSCTMSLPCETICLLDRNPVGRAFLAFCVSGSWRNFLPSESSFQLLSCPTTRNSNNFVFINYLCFCPRCRNPRIFCIGKLFDVFSKLLQIFIHKLFVSLPSMSKFSYILYSLRNVFFCPPDRNFHVFVFINYFSCPPNRNYYKFGTYKLFFVLYSKSKFS